MLYSLKKETGHERPKDKSTNKNKQKKQTKTLYPPPLTPPKPQYESITPHLYHAPIIHNNNAMDTEFLIQMRQCKKCGSVRNSELFNLQLGSGERP